MPVLKVYSFLPLLKYPVIRAFLPPSVHIAAHVGATRLFSLCLPQVLVLPFLHKMVTRLSFVFRGGLCDRYKTRIYTGRSVMKLNAVQSFGIIRLDAEVVICVLGTNFLASYYTVVPLGICTNGVLNIQSVQCTEWEHFMYRMFNNCKIILPLSGITMDHSNIVGTEKLGGSKRNLTRETCKCNEYAGAAGIIDDLSVILGLPFKCENKCTGK